MFDCFVCGNPFESEAELSKHHSEVHDLDDGYKPPGGEVTDQKNPTSNQSVPNTAVMKPSHQEFMLSNGPLTSMISNAENPPMLPNVPLPLALVANVPSKPPPKIRFSALKTTVTKPQKRLRDTKTPTSEYAIKDAKVCPICKAGFIHDNDLVDHLMKGHGDFSKPKQKQIFKCKECDFQASVEELLKNHENNFHPKLSTLPPNPVLPTADQDKFTCNVCEEKFDMEIKFFLHFKDKHTSKKVEDESSKVAAKQSIETPGAKSKGDLAAKLAKLAPQVTPMVVASMTPLQAPFVPIAPRNVPRNVPLQFPMTRLRSPMVPPSISLTPAVQGLISPHQLQNASFHFPMERLQRPLIRPKPRSPPIQAPIPILPPSISLIPASRLPVQEPTQPQSFPFIQSSASLAPIPVTASLDHVQVPAQAKLAPIQSLLEPVSTPVDQEPEIIDPEPEIIDPEPEIIDPEPEIDPVQATFDAKVPEEKIVIKEEPLDKSFTVPMLPVPINAIKPEPMDLGETNVEETEDIEFENEEIPMFNCDACSKSFIDQETLEMHKEEAHFDDDSEDEYSLENDDEFFGQDDFPANLGSGQVPCQFCPEKFNEKVELDHHILVEHLKTNFDCKICAQKCYSFRDLGLHVQNNHPKHNCDFECHICKKQFASTLNLQVHLLGMHLKVHSCEDCDQKFICKVDLVKHQDLEHPLEFKCDACDIFFKTELALSEHKLLIHPQKAFFRCKCKKTFDEARHLTTHLVYEHAGDSNKCDFCWESYGSQRKLFLHISKIHEPNFTMTTEENMEDDQEDPDTTEEEITEPIQPGDDKCPQCSKVMPKADINNHLLTVHFDFKLKCCHCQKEFKNLMALGVHKTKMHPKQKKKNEKLTCQICNKKFKKIAGLRTHLIKIHAGDKNNDNNKENLEPAPKKSKVDIFENNQESDKENMDSNDPECQLCHLKFKDLTMHYLVDHLQMKFQCQICNEGFKDFNALEAHKLVRHQENRTGFDCHICKQTFTESDVLVQHLLKNHLGIKDYKIPMKSPEHLKKSNSASHILTVHDKKPECYICRKTCGTYEMLGKHLKNAHNKTEFACHKCGNLFASYALFMKHKNEC